jgi:hypothetical protein
VPKISSVHSADLAPPPFDLGEPGTIEFTAERALTGQALNRFALSLRSPGNRAEFLAEPDVLPDPETGTDADAETDDDDEALTEASS